MFCGCVDGMIYTSLLDFKYKPPMMIGGGVWYNTCLHQCDSFRDFIVSISKSNPYNIDRFFDIYIKHMLYATKQLDNLIDDMIKYFDDNKLNYYKESYDIKQLKMTSRIQYSSEYISYYTSKRDTIKDSIDPSDEMDEYKLQSLCMY